MLRRFAVVLLAVGAGLVALVAVSFTLQPTSFRISRSRSVPAPLEAVRDTLSDASRFAALGPYLSPSDAGRTVTVSPVTRGVGAWIESRDHAGSSRLTLVAVSDAAVEYVNSNDGSEDGARLRFELERDGDATRVTFAVENELRGLGRALWPVIDLDARVGPHMEAALGRLAGEVDQSLRRRPVGG